MITENQINNLIKPLMQRQEQMNLDTLRLFGEQIRKIKKADSSDSAFLKIRQDAQTDAKKLNKKIEDNIELQLLEIYTILYLIAENVYKESEPLFRYRKIPFLNFNENKKIKKAASLVIETVIQLCEQLYKNPAFILRDLRNPERRMPFSVEDTYITITEEAIQVNKGAIDYDVAMRRTEEQLITSGLKSIHYNRDKIYTQRMDVAVRNNILDGIRMMEQNINDEAGIQFNSDGKELSAHHFSALDHEPFQGHQFTNENWNNLQSSVDFEDVNGNQFIGVERIIGVWNCRHYARSIILGYSKPLYSERELQSFIEENHAGYTLPNGKHLTMYECTQRQRQQEYRIRQAKEGLYFSKISGDINLQNKYRAQIADRTAIYETFSEACGLPVQKERTEIVTN